MNRNFISTSALTSANTFVPSAKFDRGVSLLCWAYNEEDSIQEFLERASKLMESAVEDYEIVLIDDGSTDKTYEISKRFQEKDSRLRILQNERN